ncbi:hypothetical protein [Borborobacter arsenicus]|uniref:hypothetical protein n=1 Tax=Borborobacter arsenicus TaxID=1851146 RepID=UPI001405251B|nr:hypothetical protein [Pseudaminobacter arsenicus]
MAEDKPRQLQMARSHGFEILATIVSNSFDDVHRFAFRLTVASLMARFIRSTCPLSGM